MLTESEIRKITNALEKPLANLAARFPGESDQRQPVHTVYGGAHLFKSDTAPKLGALALRALNEHAPDAATFAAASEEDTTGPAGCQGVPRRRIFDVSHGKEIPVSPRSTRL